MPLAEAEFDPRWEWVEVTAISDRERQWIKGRCNHLDTVSVTTVTGEHVAQLCRTCDTQLPP
jgi:hypothetical protein